MLKYQPVKSLTELFLHKQLLRLCANMSPPHPNFVIRATLHGTTNPTISRILSVPHDLDFGEFHQVLQVAFGWARTHLYEFAVKTADCPHIGSGMLVPLEGTLYYILDDSDPDESGRRLRYSDEVRLFEILGNSELRLEYTYDMGDNHTHIIEVLRREPPIQKRGSACLEGEGHPCAEDIGGDWKKLKNIYQKANPTQEEKEKMDWYENMCSNGDSNGLSGNGAYRWDIDSVNRQLRSLASNNYKPTPPGSEIIMV
ncbi:hypothetical protein FRC02_003431 [Tulasnella sp. 418]|nr:hypothetical protein FRC02_003431 [Tulasnella sp. 418]